MSKIEPSNDCIEAEKMSGEPELNDLLLAAMDDVCAGRTIPADTLYAEVEEDMQI